MPLSHLPCPFLLRKPQRKKDNRLLKIVASWGGGMVAQACKPTSWEADTGQL